MSSSSKSSPAPSGTTMTQKKLNFTTAKRTASASGAKKAGNVIKSTPNISSQDRTSSVEDDSKAQIIKEEDKTGLKLRTPSVSQKPKAQQDTLNEQEPVSQPRPELNLKDVRWRQLIVDAKAKRNGLPLVHGKKENEIHQILRAFDLNYDYGPCIGVTRLERWERAHALGLNPPLGIRDILSTREGSEQKTYVECVFHDEV